MDREVRLSKIMTTQIEKIAIEGVSKPNIELCIVGNNDLNYYPYFK